MLDLITTALEVLGLLALALAVGLALAELHPAAGFAGGGLALICEAQALELLASRRLPPTEEDA